MVLFLFSSAFPQEPQQLRAESQASVLEQQSSGKFLPDPMLQLIIGRKTNDTYTYSHKIVLIANLQKEASFQMKHDLRL